MEVSTQLNKVHFVTLYKKTSTGAIQQWQIYTLGNEIHTTHGQVGGKLQSTVDVIKTGKNVGKANETTPETQAQAEAAAKFEKQLKKGKAKMSGDTAKLKEYFENHELWKNKLLTVKFQDLTGYGIPRFPVGLRIREDV